MVEKKKYPVDDLGPNVPKIFLEVEVFDLNLEAGKEVAALFGVGDSFESFQKAEQVASWQQVGGGSPKEFQTDFKRKNERKCHFSEKTVDPNTCDKRHPYCDLSCPSLSSQSPGCLKIQVSRKYVGDQYDDGKRAWDGEKSVESKEGKWPEDVKINQNSEPLPTEELLTQILFYTKKDEAKYNEEKKKAAVPQLNKIMIIQKDREMEYVVDRFVDV